MSDWERELLSTTKPHAELGDMDLNQIVDSAVRRLNGESFEPYNEAEAADSDLNSGISGESEGGSYSNSAPSATSLLAHQINQLSVSSGPVEWKNDQYRWKEPSNVIYDAQRKIYVKETSGVDPLLRVEGFKQVF